MSAPAAVTAVAALHRSEKCDWLAAEIARAKKKGCANPFVYSDLRGFLPTWAASAHGVDDADAEGDTADCGSKGQRALSWAEWHLAYDAWAIAAAATKQLSYARCVEHKRFVLQVRAAPARIRCGARARCFSQGGPGSPARGPQGGARASVR